MICNYKKGLKKNLNLFRYKVKVKVVEPNKQIWDGDGDYKEFR